MKSIVFSIEERSAPDILSPPSVRCPSLTDRISFSLLSSHSRDIVLGIQLTSSTIEGNAMEDQELIEQVRAFNRFYLPFAHLLGNNYQGSSWSVAEARVLYEIYQDKGCTATDLSRILQLDKSYLHRILLRHEKRGWIVRTPDETDHRLQHLALTGAVLERTLQFIQQANRTVESVLQHLDREDKEQLSHAMQTMETVLRKGKSRNESHTL
jgi:DNA-binding MarR family transcriptional regulator